MDRRVPYAACLLAAAFSMLLGAAKATLTETPELMPALYQQQSEMESHQNSYLAFCLAVKGDAELLLEWIEYHKCLGVGRFYVYDDGTEPPLLRDLRPHVESGLVEYFYVKNGKPAQIWAYSDCLSSFRHRHQWLMGLDTDEFVVLKEAAGTYSLPEFLKGFEDYGGVAVQWRVFGSSGFQERPVGGFIRNFHKCQADASAHKDGYGIKTIANAKKAKSWVSAHFTDFFNPDDHNVDPDYKQRQSGFTMLVHSDSGPERVDRTSKIQLNHYTVGSKADFLAKQMRGGGDGNHRPNGYLRRIDAQCPDECTEGIEAGLRCLGPLPSR